MRVSTRPGFYVWRLHPYTFIFSVISMKFESVYRMHCIFFFLSMNNAFSCMINTFHSNVKVFHSFRMNFVFLVMGNVGKTKICLNLVKNFCGIGSHYDQIENEIKQIKPSPTTLKIEGKNISNWIDFNRI